MSAENPKSNPKPGTPGADGVGADGAAAPDAPGSEKSTGRVKFDDKGNAVWEWSIATGAFGREVSTERLQRLENPALSIADDSAIAPDTVRPNPLGTKKGYDPYDSGKLSKAAARRKKDLRRLSEVMKLKKQAAGNKGGTK